MGSNESQCVDIRGPKRPLKTIIVKKVDMHRLSEQKSTDCVVTYLTHQSMALVERDDWLLQVQMNMWSRLEYNIYKQER